MIEYRATIDDPETFGAPFTYRVMFTTQPNYEVVRVLVPRRQQLRSPAASRANAPTSRRDPRRGQGERAAEIPAALERHDDLSRAPRRREEVFNINAGE